MRIERKSTFNRICYGCKLSMNIDRDNVDEDIIFFDNRYYHKNCFMQLKQIRKKCCCCKKEIEIKQDDRDIVYYKNHFFHRQCFEDICNSEETNKFVSKKNKNITLSNIENYIDEANGIVNTLFENKNIDEKSLKQFHKDAEIEIKKYFDGSDLCNFLREEFDINTVPWDSIQSVISGNYKNLNAPIPADVLLDMWTRKLNYLRSANQNLISKKGNASPVDLIRYDLAILVNKYDSYLNWIEKQKVLELSKTEEKNENFFTQSIGYTTSNVKTSDDDDISDLVDEIFK